MTDTLLADLITLRDMRGNPVISTQALLDVYKVCQTLAVLSADAADSPDR